MYSLVSNWVLLNLDKLIINITFQSGTRYQAAVGRSGGAQARRHAEELSPDGSGGRGAGQHPSTVGQRTHAAHAGASTHGTQPAAGKVLKNESV